MEIRKSNLVNKSRICGQKQKLSIKFEIYSYEKLVKYEFFKFYFSVRMDGDTDMNGWTIVIRFKGNQVHMNFWNVHLWNIYYHEVDGYVDVMFHQKWWTKDDLFDEDSFSFVADQVLFTQQRKK